MIKKTSRNELRKRRHFRVRNKINGTSERPRLSVFRSSKHIYAQLVDDVNHATLAAASSLEKEAGVEQGGNVAAAQAVGKLIGERGVAKKIEQVVFDRGGYLYHGRVKALAEAAREAGLKF